MKTLTPAVRRMELYEFRYGLNNLVPPGGWSAVRLDSCEEIESRVNSRSFYDSIQIKPRIDNRIVLDEKLSPDQHAVGWIDPGCLSVALG
jgi:hypothetical protein